MQKDLLASLVWKDLQDQRVPLATLVPRETQDRWEFLAHRDLRVNSRSCHQMYFSNEINQEAREKFAVTWGRDPGQDRMRMWIWLPSTLMFTT